LREIQSETLGSIEALNRRITDLENHIQDLKAMTRNNVAAPREAYNSAFDLMTPEELGMGTAEEPAFDDSDVTVVKSGFTAPPPDVAESVEDTPETVEEEIEIPDIEPMEEILEEDSEELRGTPMDWVDAIEAHINEHGGVVNQDFKRLGLIPGDVTSSERTTLNAELADAFTKHKVNNFRIFYCSATIVEPNEVKAQYGKVFTKS